MANKEDLPVGMKVYAENHFIDMVRNAYKNVSYPNWDEDSSVSEVTINSSKSYEDTERLPRITVSVGDLQNYNGAIDHLKEISLDSRTRVFVTQGYVAITCYSNVAQEASNMAYFVSRMILAARGDLRRRGIFGMQSPQISEENPSQQGNKKDYVYGSTVQCAFMCVSNDVIQQSEAWPIIGEFVSPGGGTGVEIASGNGPGTTVHWGLGGGGTRPAWEGLTFPITMDLISVTRLEAEGDVKLSLEFNHPMREALPLGFSVKRGETEIEAVFVRDPTFYTVTVELATFFDFGLRVEYDPEVGNVTSFATGVSLEEKTIKL